MATPRKLLVDPAQPLFYHLASRCVRQSWLCGFDRRNRRDYSHRKKWFVDRIHQLGAAFALDVHSYAIMSNHFHIIVYYDPLASQTWSDTEVVDRWLKVCPPRDAGGVVTSATVQIARSQLINDPDNLIRIRNTLGSLSMFMKFLKQPIARRANREDNTNGHFFDQRFYSGALLNDDAVLAAMAYVDLNPIRAKIAQSIEQCEYTSIQERLKRLAHGESLDSYLAPVVRGLKASPTLPVTSRSYLEMLRAVTPTRRDKNVDLKLGKWRDQIFSIRRKQRAYGNAHQIKEWLKARGMQMREIPIPS